VFTVVKILPILISFAELAFQTKKLTVNAKRIMKFAALFRLLRVDMRATLLLAAPIMVAQLGNVLMGVTDSVMIRRLGVVAIDAAGFGNNIFFLVAVLGIGTLSVIAPQVAAAKGMNDTDTCARLLQTGIRLGLVIGIMLAGAVFGIVFFLDFFHQPPDVTLRAREFLSIVGISIIPMMIFLALKYFADGLAFTRVDMFITLGALALNLLLNWLLINGKWGLPALGLNGSACATLISRLCMMGAILVYIFYMGPFQEYRKALKMNYLQPFFLKIIRQGFPAGLQYFFEAGAFAMAAIMTGWINKYQQAAHLIAISPASVTYMAMAGIGAASAIRVGRARGENSRSGILRAGTVSLLLVVAFMAMACVIFVFFPQPIIQLYLDVENPTDAPRVVPIAITLLVIAGFFQLSDGVQVVGLSNLRGIEDVKVPTYLTFFAYWGVGLPVGYVLAFPLQMQATGLWIGLTAGLTTSAILLTTRFYTLSNKIRLRWSPDIMQKQHGKDAFKPQSWNGQEHKSLTE
jgi:multidrug resistance protein, MATE family